MAKENEAIEILISRDFGSPQPLYPPPIQLDIWPKTLNRILNPGISFLSANLSRHTRQLQLDDLQAVASGLKGLGCRVEFSIRLRVEDAERDAL